MRRAPRALSALLARRFRLTFRGWAMLASGTVLVIAAYAVGRTELLYLGVFLVAAPLLALAVVRFRRVQMGVSRRFVPHLASAGRQLEVSLDVRNRGTSRTASATWRDGLPWSPFTSRHGTLHPLAPYRNSRSTGTSTTVDYRVVPPRRGIVDIGPFIVDFADPFELASGEIVVGERHKLVVTPAVVTLPDAGQSIAADEGSARALQHRSSANEDELMTREYRAGDPLRRVHWKASARHGELMVRQEEQRSHAQARVLIDTRRGGYRDVQRASANEPESESFEWLVAFAGSLVFRLQQSGFTVELVETAARQLASAELHDELLESLATVELLDEPRHDDQLYLRPDPGRSLGSVFALLSDAEPHVVDRLAAQRVHFDLAVAFVVAGRREAVAEPLAEAGWLCVEVLPDDDPVDVWLTVARAREEAGVRG
ncbi:MAG: DUF58 domain-containing protein [Cryobacterium sp.]|nr:DUF58 domain-containing protein [Cryobacterium sp.]